MRKILLLSVLFLTLPAQAWYETLRVTWLGTANVYLEYSDRWGNSSGAVGPGYTMVRSFPMASLSSWTLTWATGSTGGDNIPEATGILDISIGGAAQPIPWKLAATGRNDTPYPKTYTPTVNGVPYGNPFTVPPGMPWRWDMSTDTAPPGPVEITSPNYDSNGNPTPGYTSGPIPATTPPWNHDGGSAVPVVTPFDDGIPNADTGSQGNPNIVFPDTTDLAKEGTLRTFAENNYNVTANGFQQLNNTAGLMNQKLEQLFGSQGASNEKLEMIRQIQNSHVPLLQGIQTSTANTKIGIDNVISYQNTANTKLNSIDVGIAALRNQMDMGPVGTKLDTLNAKQSQAYDALTAFKNDQHGDMTALNEKAAGMILGQQEAGTKLSAIDAGVRSYQGDVTIIRDRLGSLSDIENNTRRTADSNDEIVDNTAGVSGNVQTIKDNSNVFKESWAKFSEWTTNALQEYFSRTNVLETTAEAMGKAQPYANSMSEAVLNSRRVTGPAAFDGGNSNTEWMKVTLWSGFTIDLDFMKMPYMEDAAQFCRTVSKFICAMTIIFLLYGHIGEEFQLLMKTNASQSGSQIARYSSPLATVVSIAVAGVCITAPAILMSFISDDLISMFAINPLNGWNGPIGYGCYLLEHWFAVSFWFGAWVAYYVSRHSIWAATLAKGIFLKFAH